MKTTLIDKYNVPGPRYTSYPTVPYWDAEAFTREAFLSTLRATFKASNHQEGISVYIHLPFCETLCTFCACHKHITKRHEVEETYIETVLKEWRLYLNLLGETPVIKEIHLGGGTPTFFSIQYLEQLIQGIVHRAKIHPNHEFSFEGHPNNTTREHLQTLYDLGFRRVSFGVQDYDEKVQSAINRHQTYQQVKAVTEWSRNIGYHSVSHDLIFGLPFQTAEAVENSIRQTQTLRPDRISFYSYAHVPWIKGVGQRGFKEEDLPKSDEKRALYETGKQMLTDLGYEEIGMDHFALPSDSLHKATEDQTLHRNFMGYTTKKTQVMIALGMSAISDSWSGFAQNVKTVKEYQAMVSAGEIPIFRGHILSDEDLVIRQHILNLMCQLQTSWESKAQQFTAAKEMPILLSELIKDGLVMIDGEKLTIPEQARPFVRNVCMGFDQYLQKNQPNTQLFSMTI